MNMRTSKIDEGKRCYKAKIVKVGDAGYKVY